MKAVELREEILEIILDEVQTSVMRLGINADLEYVTSKDYRGNKILQIESSKFQTTPVVFKELWLKCNVVTYEEPHYEDYIGVHISIDYHWKSFRGGTNGTDLGSIRFLVEKDLPEKLSIESARLCVRKLSGLEI